MVANTFHIDPKLIAVVRDLEWVIKAIALGHYNGHKVSKKLGSGIEFSQYRPYSQGDDLRQLDWKMYARTDRFYIRQSETEADIEVNFIIDTSRSMRYEEDGLDKLTFAKLLCGVLAFIAKENGDTIHLSGQDATTRKNDSRQWIRLLNRLHLAGETDRFVKPHIQGGRHRELYVIVSDMYEEERILPFVKSLKTRRNEVILFHVLGAKERSFDFRGTVKMKDLETSETLQLNADAYGDQYRESLGHWLEGVKQELLISGIDYYDVDFNVAVDLVVQRFLNLRKRLL